jgi:acyl-CoA reductase-like NAD-dependent aldehyde dehydrogenase
MTNHHKFKAYDPASGRVIDVVRHADVRQADEEREQAAAAAEAQAAAEARVAETDQMLAELTARHEQRLREGKLWAYDPASGAWRRMGRV